MLFFINYKYIIFVYFVFKNFLNNKFLSILLYPDSKKKNIFPKKIKKK